MNNVIVRGYNKYSVTAYRSKSSLSFCIFSSLYVWRRNSQGLGRLLHLRVREGQPDFTHFAFGKESVDDFDVGTEESHILHAFVQGISSPCPHTCALATFAFQGGEPTLAGLDFYRKLLEFEKKYNLKKIPVQNAIQTNGYIIDEEFGQDRSLTT